MLTVFVAEHVNAPAKMYNSNIDLNKPRRRLFCCLVANHGDDTKFFHCFQRDFSPEIGIIMKKALA